MGRLCYPTQAPGRVLVLSQKAVTVQGGYGTCFCCHGTRFIGCRRGRGTSLKDGQVFISIDEVTKGHWRGVAEEVVSEAEISQGAGF